jgi:hypothetical protein
MPGSDIAGSWSKADHEVELESMGSTATVARAYRNLERAVFAMLYCLVKDNLLYKKLTFGAIILEWIQVRKPVALPLFG